MNRYIVAFFVIFSLFPASNVIAQTVGASGLKLPRFVSLSTTTANLRTGPGTNYPIKWTYKRRGHPLEIIEEHGHWRKVRDQDTTEGWILKILLFGPRTAVVRGKTRQLFKDNDLSSKVLLVAEKDVSGKVLKCVGIWCRVEIDGTKAWIERRHLWGVHANEEID
ncbi:MAG: SH3 domain-containing protein [Kordiimonadaceae bacterium]|nr:SH3 domain-containing protein [Kordiimonadaceae bacterium]